MITIVTGNPEKQKEFSRILPSGITFASPPLKEIQSWSLRGIVEQKARDAFAAIGTPVIVEDVALEIAAMNRFPGPFVKYWEREVGYETALLVCQAKNNNAVQVRCAQAYCDANGVLYAEQVDQGRFVPRTDGEGFGFDFYFILDGHEKTYAQMGRDEKIKISHRTRCFEQLVEQLKQKQLL